MKATGKERDEVAEHVAGSREAVKQQEIRAVGWARLAIEDPEAVHVNFSIVDGRHDAGLRTCLLSAHSAAVARYSAPRYRSQRLTNGRHDGCWRSHRRCVIDGLGAHAGLHALGHESLGFLDDHPILLRHEVPGWTVFPERAWHCDGDAGGRNRALDCGEHDLL